MAQKMGKGLGRGKILLRPLPWQCQEASTLNPATQGSLLFSGATRNKSTQSGHTLVTKDRDVLSGRI
jgi:hypothetical protein